MNTIKNKDFKNILVVDEIESTNKELKKDQYSVFSNFVLISNCQTSGVGRMERRFVSNKNAGLYMSIRIKPTRGINELQNITCVVSGIVTLALEKQINQKLDIKWVNDIYLNGFKIAGILVESKVNFNSNAFEYLIIGIGINLYKQSFDNDLKTIASSVEDELEIKVSKELLVSDILDYFSKYMISYDSSFFMKEYIDRSFVIGKNIKLKTNTALINCKVLDINSNGELIIDDNGSIKTVTSAEVVKTYV